MEQLATFLAMNQQEEPVCSPAQRLNPLRRNCYTTTVVLIYVADQADAPTAEAVVIIHR